MSIDPALEIVNYAIEFPDVADLPVGQQGVYIFDFDGVITSRTEDDIYKLPETTNEAGLFEEAERLLDVNFSRLDHRYRRHLLFQAAAWYIKLPIEKGRGFEKARMAARCSNFFILTARSGWYAVERQRKFVAENNIQPIDCYNVGRVRKDRQIEMLVDEFKHNRLYYVDDSLQQCNVVAGLGFENVDVFSCIESRSNCDPTRVYRDVMQRFLDMKCEDL